MVTLNATNLAEDFFGRLCRLIIPIETNRFTGKGKTIGICTLSSLSLLKEISADKYLMKKIAIAGRLFSANKGIDQIVQYCNQNESVKHLVVCGIDTKGHLAGNALLRLHEYGVGIDGRILNSSGHKPFVSLALEAVEAFRKNVYILNLIGVTDLEVIKGCIDNIQ